MIKDNLLLRIENQVSNYESIENIDSLIDKALTQADGIIKNKDVSEAVREDIAYFRFLLFVSQNYIDDNETNMYKTNLTIVEKAPVKQNTLDNEEPRASFSKVATRRTF